MPLPEISFEDFRRVVEMLQTTITGMADLANRVKALEDANDAHFAAAVALRESQQQLFEAYKAQQELNTLVKQSLDTLLRVMGTNGPVN